MPPTNGYSHVVTVQPCETIYFSGQVPLDRAGNIVGVGSMEAQTTQVFENIKHGLVALNLTFDNVVKLVFYVSDMTKMAEVRKIRDMYINVDTPPASSAVEVSRLIDTAFMIEIEAVVIKPMK